MAAVMAALWAAVSTPSLNSFWRAAPIACPVVPNLTVVVTAHICDPQNARLLVATVSSIQRHAPQAHVIIVDSASAWDVARLVQNASVYDVRRLERDDGQLGALRLLELSGESFERLLFLQHSTPLVRCVPRMPQHCHARAIVRENEMDNPYWRKHELTHDLLRRLGVRPPWNWTVVNHCAFEVTATGFERMRAFGLWGTTGREGALGMLSALAELGAGPQGSRKTRMKGGVTLEVHQALEAICGAAAGAANMWRTGSSAKPRLQLGPAASLRSLAGLALSPCGMLEDYYGVKKHGKSFVRAGNCTTPRSGARAPRLIGRSRDSHAHRHS